MTARRKAGRRTRVGLRKKVRRKAASARKKTARKKTARKKTARKKTARKKTARKKKAASKKKTARKKKAARPRRGAVSPPPKRTAKKKPARLQQRVSRRRRSARRVYSFGGGRADGRADMRDLLGGKGANLAEMTRLGVPVPPGFTLSTEVCSETARQGGRISPALRADVQTALARVERLLGRRFGGESPLLVSVRSGAPVSMPGMMATVLNLGLNDETVQGLAEQADERFALDSYRRFVQMYGDVVLGVPRGSFERRITERKLRHGVHLDSDLDADDLRVLVKGFLEMVEAHTGEPFPQDPFQQLWGAVGAVFRSWNNTHAIEYRKLYGIPEEGGTAVNIQAMVFGNMGDDCATGVCFSRDPNTGHDSFWGEYLVNAQGEDVVAGVRTPQPINAHSRTERSAKLTTLEEQMPGPYRELLAIRTKLERHYGEMQDMEFTIERGALWVLQTRTGKRSARAAVQIAVDMARERMITREEAIRRVDANSLDALLHPTLDPEAKNPVIGRGLPASPGAAVGRIAFSAADAEARAKAGDKVILVRVETSPEDIVGMNVSEGVLTARGGMTSHAAVVARGMGRCCVVGCGELEIDLGQGAMRIGDHRMQEGDELTLDGSTGEILLGAAPTILPQLGGAFDELMRWSDRIRVLKVRTNADAPADAKIARDFGAEGIGLCRTEHMFFDPDRILAVRRMILAVDDADRAAALDELLPMQRADFEGIFRAMEGLPVTIRLLDPPLHEFLPQRQEEDEIVDLAQALGMSLALLRSKLRSLHEHNPMLGHRGCRLGVTYPEIYNMQVRAITEAACRVAASGMRVRPEIMVPLVSNEGELALLREQAEGTIAEVRARFPGTRVRPEIGTMIEVPRAALTADVIAEHADFFSFGTNDLTQMTYALSRDDAEKFLHDYIEGGILANDPFVSIDEEGIGQLVKLGAERGRATRPGLKLGICGEHGGDPQSVKFFARIGLDYVSCSPYRVPLARLAAAQAALEQQDSGAGRT